MFISWEFWLFAAVVLALYHRVGQRAQNVLLLTSSYLLYACLDWRMLPVLIGTTTVTWWIGSRLTLGLQKQRLYLCIGIAINVTVLVGFKVGAARASLVLPLGLSFYTFRHLSYLIDRYRRRIAPTSWADAALYAAFFPQIAAGPIERAARFLPALRTRRGLDEEQVGIALTYLLAGLFYKVVIADPMAPFTEQLFNNVYAISAPDALAGMVGVGVRLYADFAGYSAMAIGLSLLFGLPAMDNFRQPFLAQSVVDFWTRWHISLSTWFREYLFYPLARFLLRRTGAQHAFLVETFCLFVTMLLIGLWHGLAAPFVVWGALHAAYMTAERLLNRTDPDRAAPDEQAGPWPRRLAGVGSIVVTQVVVSVAWVVFHSPTLPRALVFFQRLLTPMYSFEGVAAARLLVPLLLVIVFDLVQAKTRLLSQYWHWPLLWRVTLLAFVILAFFIAGTTPHGVFIYARF